MPQQSIALAIVQRLHRAGFEAYWVGGCVRDFLLGREPDDYDVATSARPEQIERLFYHTLPVGKQFGVILVVESDVQVEVATFRADAEYQDGRHPTAVEFANAQADATRRDFTVNGLFYDPITKRVHDWVGGEADLRARIIRTIGVPEQRFQEDHLRLLRAVRLAAQLDFAIAPDTFAAVRQQASSIVRVSPERIRDELVKLFRPPHAARGLVLLEASGLLACVLPEVQATVGCEQSPAYHPEGTVFNHIVRMLELLPTDAPASLPWAALLHDVGKPATMTRDGANELVHFYGHEKVGAEMAEEILRRLKFPRKQIDEIVQCVRCHMQFKDVPQMRLATVRRLILRPTFLLELELHRLDCLGSHGQLDIYDSLRHQAEALKEQPQLVPPLVTGSDLMALGMKPGPAMGALLHQIRDKQLQGELTTSDQARAWAAEQLANPSAGR